MKWVGLGTRLATVQLTTESLCVHVHIVLKRLCCLPQRYADWLQKFGHHLGKKVVLLTGETSVDLRLLRDVS